MVTGAWWKRWLCLYLPLGAVVILTLFPFYYMAVTAIRPDREMYIPWNRPNFAPFWTAHPTLEHFALLFRETLFSQWLVNTFVISLGSTAISLFCGLLAAYALARLRFPGGGAMGTGIFVTYLVPQTLLFIPLGEVIRTFRLGGFSLGADPHLPHVPHSVLHVAHDGLLPDDPQGAGRVRPDRRRLAHAGHGSHRLPGGHAGNPLGRYLRVHALLERVPLRPRIPVQRHAKRPSRSES